jgi:glycosyltransferase involved in cell wall biosynthesis
MEAHELLPSVEFDWQGHYHDAPELLGLVVLEAMHCGSPAVVSNVGGIPEVVDHGRTGFVVEPGDIESLRKVLDELGRDDDLVQTMGEAARNEVARRFTWNEVAARALNFYERLCNK